MSYLVVSHSDTSMRWRHSLPVLLLPCIRNYTLNQWVSYSAVHARTGVRFLKEDATDSFAPNDGSLLTGHNALLLRQITRDL